MRRSRISSTGRRLGDHAGAKKELQVVIDLMPIGGGKGGFNGVVEQETAAVARVPDAQRECVPARPSRRLETRFGKAGRRQSAPPGIRRISLANPSGPRCSLCGFIDDLAIHCRMMPIEFTDPGLGKQNDFRPRKPRAQGVQGGNGHHRVAHPIGGPHQNALYVRKAARKRS